MKVILTSFGIADKTGPANVRSMFYQMPPVYMESVADTFLADYAALLLCEKVILDEASFDSLLRQPHSSYRRVAETFRALFDEGFVELVSFKNILSQSSELLDRMISHDLSMLDSWVKPFTESLDIWDDFVRRASKITEGEQTKHVGAPDFSDIFRWMHAPSDRFHESGLAAGAELLREALSSSKKRKLRNPRGVLRDMLRSYLSYVNANIVLSNQLGVGFHDWIDFMPFYQQKFLNVGRETIESECEIEQANKLFEFVVPEFLIRDASSLIKTLQDKRISSLRQLVQEAVDGKVTFDQDFANKTLKEVIGVTRDVERYRRIVSYRTMALGFIPWIGTPLQKATEEVFVRRFEDKLKKPYQWFYLLSDISRNE